MLFETKHIMPEMQALSVQLTNEAFLFGSIVDTGAEYFNKLLNGLTQQKNIINEDAKHKEFASACTKEENQHFGLMSTFDYLSWKDIRIYKPSGLKCTYLQYSEALAKEAERSESLQKDVVAPFLVYLGQVLSSPEKAQSSNTSFISRAKTLEAARTKTINAIGQCFNATQQADARACTLIERSADWKIVTESVCRTSGKIESVKLKELVQQTTQAEDYMRIIMEQCDTQKMILSKEQRGCIASLCYQVACELEAFSLLRYRVQVFKTSLTQSVYKIRNFLLQPQE